MKTCDTNSFKVLLQALIGNIYNKFQLSLTNFQDEDRCYVNVQFLFMKGQCIPSVYSHGCRNDNLTYFYGFPSPNPNGNSNLDSKFFDVNTDF